MNAPSNEPGIRAAERVRVLAIFYYVVGAIHLFTALVFLAWVGLGMAVLTAPAGGQERLRMAGWALLIGGALGLLFGLFMAAMRFLAGRALSIRRHRGFVLAVAAFGCLWFPYGTALGIFTFLALNDPAARNLFSTPPSPVVHPPAVPPALPTPSASDEGA